MDNSIQAGVVGLLGLVLGSWLSGHRDYAGRVWALKAECYSDILGSLHVIQEYYEQLIEDEINSVDTTSERALALGSAATKATQSIFENISRRSWVLPEQPRLRLVAYRREMTVRQEGWFEHIDHCASLTRRVSIEIEEVARKQMIQRQWPTWRGSWFTRVCKKLSRQ